MDRFVRGFVFRLRTRHRMESILTNRQGMNMVDPCRSRIQKCRSRILRPLRKRHQGNRIHDSGTFDLIFY